MDMQFLIVMIMLNPFSLETVNGIGRLRTSSEVNVKARNQGFPRSLKTFLSHLKNKDNFHNFAV